MSTFDDIARRVIVEAGLEPFGLTPEFIVDGWLTSRYRRIIDKMPFGDVNFWGDVVLNTSPQYNEGTVEINQNSQQLVGSGTTFDITMISKFIRIGLTRGWYRIIDFIDETHLLLDQPFVGESISQSGYFIAQRYYELPEGVRWVVDCKNVSRAFPVQKTHRLKLDEMFPDRIASPGVPLWWCPAGWNVTTGRRLVEIYPFANSLYRLEFSGYANVDEPGLDNSPVPDIEDRILIEGALADAFNYRAPRSESIELVRAWLDVSRRHENLFDDLLETMSRRDSLDSAKPRVRLNIQRRETIGIVDPLTNAEQEVFSRAPNFG